MDVTNVITFLSKCTFYGEVCKSTCFWPDNAASEDLFSYARTHVAFLIQQRNAITYRVSLNEWTPHNTKYGLFLIVLCKSYEIYTPCLGLDIANKSSNPNQCEICPKDNKK